MAFVTNLTNGNQCKACYVCNCTCIQMGVAGSFVADKNGTLNLYYNDTVFSNNSGVWTICISPGGCVDLDATNSSGVVWGAVTSGTVYTYTCPGLVYNTADFPLVQNDADGLFYGTDWCTLTPYDGNPGPSPCGPYEATSTEVCLHCKNASLVGKIL